MRSALIRTLALASVLLALGGTYLLDFCHNVRTGYGILLLGALVLVLLPDCTPAGRQGRQTRRLTWFSAAVLFIGGAVLSARVAASVGKFPTMSGSAQALLWLSGCLGVVLAYHLLDRRRGPFVQLFDHFDWVWILGLAVAASAARILYLGVSPPGLVYDELVPLSRTLAITNGANPAAFWIDDFALNGLFYHLNALSISYLGWLGLDAVQAAKLPGALSGGLSVAALYATARILGTRPVAAAAGVFLTAMGWHWVLSRLYYAYAGDLLWISLATALLAAGLRSRRLSLLAFAATTSAVGVGWLKTAVLVAPWSGIVLLDHVCTGNQSRASRFLPLLAWGAAFAVCVLPPAVQLVKQSSAGWRYEQVSRERIEEFGKLGLTPAQGLGEGLMASIGVLQVRDAVRSRHSPRPGRPALDMVVSAMATVGFLACLRRFCRDRAARLCLLGFLLFLLPAVWSYPVNLLAATSRRMAGASIFLAWMAAQGTALVTERLLAPRLRFAGMLVVAVTSMVLSAHALRTVYGVDGFIWYDELGVNRVYLLRALREASEVGPVFFRTTHQSAAVVSGIQDRANVMIVKSPTEVREELRKHAGELCTVILPWDTKFDPNDSPRWIEELVDVIPAYTWQWGPPDLLGSSIYRLAQVRVPAHP